MRLFTNRPDFYNDICEEIRLVLGATAVERVNRAFPDAGGLFMSAIINDEGASAALYENGAKKAARSERRPPALGAPSADPLVIKRYDKRLIKNAVFKTLKDYAPASTPWGSLTGIRPTKLMRELIAERGREQAIRSFREDFHVSKEKVKLSLEIVDNQRELIKSVRPGDMDVYIGIPFCMSRCSYCSFASNDVAKAGGLIDEYLDKLIFEMGQTARLAKSARCVYIGGGTPTALSAKQLSRLLDAVDGLFTRRLEYTVEAGRPDTIDMEKLSALKSHGVTRISINPQTLNEKTLEAIGRKHTPAQIYEAFGLARRMGFDNLNSDIIAGLPGEGEAEINKTLAGVLELAPESVTVHTLAIKRASKLKEAGYSPGDAARLVDICAKTLGGAGYRPYYMYRQKYMSGNLENTGYALPGRECAYNVDNMEETVSVIAYGAGAISKRVIPEHNRIERCANVSDLGNYLERAGEMAERKLRLFD